MPSKSKSKSRITATESQAQTESLSQPPVIVTAPNFIIYGEIHSRIDNRFSRAWQYPTYYNISGVWLLVPWCLYEMVSRS